MKYLHTMIRVRDLDAALKFFCDGLGLTETRRVENEKGRFTLVFLAAKESPDAEIELTYNWPTPDGSTEDYGTARNFRHLRAPASDGHHDQPPAARRPHGLRALARSDLGRTAAGWPSAAAGALGVDAEHGNMVASRVLAVARHSGESRNPALYF